MDVFKRFCYGERKFYDAMKEQCQVSCVKIFLSWFIRYITHITNSLNFKNTEKVVKIGCFENVCEIIFAIYNNASFFEVKEGYEVSCVKILCYAKLLVGCYLYEI